jgi:hypothetical protein
LLSKLNNDELVKNLDVDWGTLSPIKLSCERCAVKEFDNWSARYYGKIYFPAAGTYYLGMDSDDGARIWLDGKLVMDNWYIPDELAVWSKVIQIDTPGEHLLRVEYWDGEGPAHAQLLWASNLLSFGGVVPSIYLTPLDWNPPLPNTKNGDVVWVDAVTGEIIDIINTIIEE